MGMLERLTHIKQAQLILKATKLDMVGIGMETAQLMNGMTTVEAIIALEFPLPPRTPGQLKEHIMLR